MPELRSYEVEYVEGLVASIKELEEKNNYLKTWGHNQYGNLKDRIAKLEADKE